MAGHALAIAPDDKFLNSGLAIHTMVSTWSYKELPLATFISEGLGSGKWNQNKKHKTWVYRVQRKNDSGRTDSFDFEFNLPDTVGVTIYGIYFNGKPIHTDGIVNQIYLSLPTYKNIIMAY